MEPVPVSVPYGLVQPAGLTALPVSARLRAAAVILNQRHIGQVEVIQELPDKQGKGAQAEIRVVFHRDPVPAQREVRHYAAVLRCQTLHHVAIQTR